MSMSTTAFHMVMRVLGAFSWRFVLVLVRLTVVTATLIANASAGWPARSLWCQGRNETDRKIKGPAPADRLGGIRHPYRLGIVGSWLQANVSGSPSRKIDARLNGCGDCRCVCGSMGSDSVRFRVTSACRSCN